ncbi:hypothetical protein [Clostridium sp.]|uniref:hypothetical protein n=1 Tax=Clostridium sp. TaxID=1506 RepID=UPI002590A6FB|nr:hypothetical protein [Clostridium sp.]MDF2505850.1 hypothetical protein [Clostridium sp.]
MRILVRIPDLSEDDIEEIFNPCPPFLRGEEASADVINSHYFVGYEFKKSLLYVQQAIILFCCNNKIE